MVEDPKWELAILATVQGFYEKLLQESVGVEVPVPPGLEAISLQQADGSVHQTLDKMRRWLRLLDLAITPAMLRRAFTDDTDPEIAEAVLRYFTRKKDNSDVKRDLPVPAPARSGPVGASRIRTGRLASAFALRNRSDRNPG